MERKYFGTDGIRGRVGEPPITADFMLRLGRAAGVVLAAGDPRAVVIGKDTRISGYMFESALEAGLSAAGANVALLGPMPTPAVAYLTRTLYACAGIVISASHNPYFDNGIKFFSADGEKLPDEVEAAIEAELDQPFTTVDSASMGKAVRLEDAAGRYIEFCKGTMPFGTLFSGLRIVVDCANGSTYKVGPAVLRELGADVTVIGNEPNGLNINDGFGSTNPEALRDAVLRTKADLGVAFDGDGDRLIMVDGDGATVDGDDMLYILARARLEAGQFEGGVVGTVMTNLGLELALKELGIPFLRTPVGDRHIHRALVDKGLGARGRGLRPPPVPRSDQHRRRHRERAPGPRSHRAQRSLSRRVARADPQDAPDHDQRADRRRGQGAAGRFGTDSPGTRSGGGENEWPRARHPQALGHGTPRAGDAGRGGRGADQPARAPAGRGRTERAGMNGRRIRSRM